MFQFNRNRLELIWEEKRLLTFERWVFGDKQNCSARNLAQAGFYFTGSKEEPDSVTCFFCEKCLDGWEPNDNPWKEHINHSRECTFAKMQKPEADWTYAEFLDLRDELLRRLIKKACDQSLEQFDNMVEAHKKLMKTYD